MKVMTFQSPLGHEVRLTNTQINMLRRRNVWLLDINREEYCSVVHGLHSGKPTYTNREILKEIDKIYDSILRKLVPLEKGFATVSVPPNRSLLARKAACDVHDH